jgi:hypothetical protein
MTAAEYVEARQALHLSGKAAAELFGITPRSEQRYSGGTAEIPRPVEILVRFMLGTSGNGRATRLEVIRTISQEISSRG